MATDKFVNPYAECLMNTTKGQKICFSRNLEKGYRVVLYIRLLVSYFSLTTEEKGEKKKIYFQHFQHNKINDLLLYHHNVLRAPPSDPTGGWVACASMCAANYTSSFGKERRENRTPHERGENRENYIFRLSTTFVPIM